MIYSDEYADCILRKEAYDRMWHNNESVVWKYAIVSLPPFEFETVNVLNELGTDGWELVAVDFEHNKAVLKKPSATAAKTTSTRSALSSWK
jgi:hypothetical protein